MNLLDSTDSDESDQPAAESRPLTRDDIFALLSNCRRRYVIQYLRAHGATQLGDLSERIAAMENETTRSQISSDQRRRVYTSLQQTHLPKLRKNGVISYDSRSGEVDSGPALNDVDIYLEVGTEEAAWSKVYLLSSVIGVVLMVATISNVYPFTVIPDPFLGGLIAGTFLLLSLSHIYLT